MAWRQAAWCACVVAAALAVPGVCDIDALLRRAEEAAGRGLPAGPIVNKIREGLAKGYPPARIDQVLQEIAGRLATAGGLFGEMDVDADEDAVTLLAEALGAGVTPGEVRDLRQRAGVPATIGADELAGAARGLSFIKEAGLPVDDGAAVMAEALRQGYRQYEIHDVGREVKRRAGDYQAGNASLAALRDAIARGTRPERLFLDRPVPLDRPTRVERPARPEPAPRPERPTRPERPAGGSPTR